MQRSYILTCNVLLRNSNTQRCVIRKPSPPFALDMSMDAKAMWAGHEINLRRAMFANAGVAVVMNRTRPLPCQPIADLVGSGALTFTWCRELQIEIAGDKGWSSLIVGEGFNPIDNIRLMPWRAVDGSELHVVLLFPTQNG